MHKICHYIDLNIANMQIICTKSAYIYSNMHSIYRNMHNVCSKYAVNMHLICIKYAIT